MKSHVHGARAASLRSRNVLSLLIAGSLALSLASGCEKKEKKTSAEVKQAAPAPRTLQEQASSVVKKVRDLEHKKDVTCWTSFRQLDQFIATKSYSEFATLAKIASQKAMVRSVWERASANAGAAITADDVNGAIELRDVVVSDDERRRLKSFATDLGMKDFDDYRKTGEHYRVLLAVTTDAIYHGTELKALTPDAEDALADVAMQLSLELLKESGKIATEFRSPFIEGDHVKEAHQRIAKAYGLEEVVQPGGQIEPKLIAERLFPVTQALIEAKVAALDHFNAEDPRSPYKAENTLDAINLVTPMKVTPDGLQRFVMDLRSFTRFAAGGLEPMRSDNYLSDGQYEPSRLERKLYVDVVSMENAIMQIFPHVVMPNGDIKIRLEPNPATIASKDREPRDILLLDHQQNAIRDSAVHWEILRAEFEQRPFALDPFAAELLSEVVSTMLTHYLWEGARVAEEMGKDVVDAEVAARVRDKTYVMTMPEREERRHWTDADEARKKTVLAAYDPPLFADVTARSGLPTELDLEAVGEDVVRSDIQRVMGAGIAVGDPNGDGRPDVFLAGEGLGRLYLSGGNGVKFKDATTAWGIPSELFDSRHALFADYDEDGDHDLLIIRSSHPSMLLRNDGERFTDVTSDSGLRTANGAHVASMFDFDGDGDLDIYVGYYGSAEVNSGKSNARNLPAIDGRNGTPNQMWRQEEGKFVEVGAQIGVADVGWTLAAAAFDYDADGDQDLYLANDFGRNAFLRNDGGKFVDIGHATHTADRGSGMNVSFTDVDGNGLPDWYVTNIDMFSKNIKVFFPTEETTVNVDESLQKAFQYIAGNKLYTTHEADGEWTFESEELERFEPGDRGWGWDANFFDYDLDGDEDLYISNGWIEGSYAEDQKNQMFINHEGFFFVAPNSPEAFEGNSRAVAAADFDGDGDEDLIVNNFRQPPRVLENRQATSNGWAKLRLASPARAGAVVTLTADGDEQKRWTTIGRGYLSQESAEVIFGLGTAEAWSAEVKWPDGTRSTASGKAGDVVAVKPGGK